MAAKRGADGREPERRERWLRTGPLAVAAAAALLLPASLSAQPPRTSQRQEVGAPAARSPEKSAQPTAEPRQRPAAAASADKTPAEPSGSTKPPSPRSKSAPLASEEGGRPSAPAPAPSSPAANEGLGFVLSVGLLSLLFFGLYLGFRSGALSTQKLFDRLGLNPPLPEDLVDDGTGGELKQPPPPVQVPEGACPFCGQMKDPATGLCACSVAVPTAAGPPAASGPRLVGVAGPAAGRVLPITDDATLGRDPSNPMALPDDPAVSRAHARLQPGPGTCRVVDLGSSNGTYVNGARVQEAELQPGDEVTFGQSRFRFEV